MIKIFKRVSNLKKKNKMKEVNFDINISLGTLMGDENLKMILDKIRNETKEFSQVNVKLHVSQKY